MRQIAEGLRRTAEQAAEIFRQANEEQTRIRAEMQRMIQMSHQMDLPHNAPASES
jgi:hypothetical protein